MRAPLQAITDADLKTVDGVTGQEIWDAINEVGLIAGTRARIFNALINNFGTETMTLKDLYYQADNLRGRSVSIYNKFGVFTDINYVGPDSTYYVVVDGLIYGGPEDQKVKILPDADHVPVSRQIVNDASAEEWARRVRDGFTEDGYMRAGFNLTTYTEETGRWALEHLDELRGRTVEVRMSEAIHPYNGGNIVGILRDARATSQWAVNFLIGDQLVADNLDATVRIYEPEFCRTRSSDEKNRCQLLRHHTGQHKF